MLWFKTRRKEWKLFREIRRDALNGLRGSKRNRFHNEVSFRHHAYRKALYWKLWGG